jgi:hypothetical protein
VAKRPPVARLHLLRFGAQVTAGRDAENLTDEDLLREGMNTVGKADKLGEYVKCVVSVSMLTEGWDANTVTHVLGVRAFGTQPLSEQVVGRGLRRMSYAANERGMFEPEYAEVYGAPFSFIPCSGSTKDPPPGTDTDPRPCAGKPNRLRDQLPISKNAPLRSRSRSAPQSNSYRHFFSIAKGCEKVNKLLHQEQIHPDASSSIARQRLGRTNCACYTAYQHRAMPSGPVRH